MAKQQTTDSAQPLVLEADKQNLVLIVCALIEARFNTKDTVHMVETAINILNEINKNIKPA
jgi:hypothetical protein